MWAFRRVYTLVTVVLGSKLNFDVARRAYWKDAPITLGPKPPNSR